MNKKKISGDIPLLFIFYVILLSALYLQLASQLKPLVKSFSKSLQFEENN